MVRLEILRIEQWYKNLAVFLAIFFYKPETTTLILAVQTFIAFCLVSSAGYIFNDILDRNSDKKHPEKKFRQIASGQISVGAAATVMVGLFTAGFVLAPTFGVFLLLAAMCILNYIYTTYARNVAFLDIHLIAVNFLIRAVAGAVAINVESSAWLIITVFFTALLLAVGKRRGELIILGTKAKEFKQVYRVYTQEILDLMLGIITAVLLISYCLYIFMVHNRPIMICTIPFASFVTFKYLHYIMINHKMARKAHYIFTDPYMMTAICVWAAFIVAGVYF